MAIAAVSSSTTCQCLTQFCSPRAYHIASNSNFNSKPTYFQLFLANTSLSLSSTPTISFNSPLPVKAQAANPVPGDGQPMLPPYNVLITGSTKGFSFSLPEFARRKLWEHYKLSTHFLL